MKPFDEEQVGMARAMSTAAHASGVSSVAEEMIAIAARWYFAVYPATDSNAAHLIDIIMGALDEAEACEGIEV